MTMKHALRSTTTYSGLVAMATLTAMASSAASPGGTKEAFGNGFNYQHQPLDDDMKVSLDAAAAGQVDILERPQTNVDFNGQITAHRNPLAKAMAENLDAAAAKKPGDYITATKKGWAVDDDKSKLRGLKVGADTWREDGGQVLWHDNGQRVLIC